MESVLTASGYLLSLIRGQEYEFSVKLLVISFIKMQEIFKEYIKFAGGHFSFVK